VRFFRVNGRRENGYTPQNRRRSADSPVTAF
jgi:hypothetical protein